MDLLQETVKKLQDLQVSPTPALVFLVKPIPAPLKRPGMLVALGGPLKEKWLYAQPRDEENGLGEKIPGKQTFGKRKDMERLLGAK